MNKHKVRKLKWNLKKLKGLVLHFIHFFKKVIHCQCLINIDLDLNAFKGLIKKKKKVFKGTHINF